MSDQSPAEISEGENPTHGKNILPFPARRPLMRAEHCVDEATTDGGLEISFTANQRDNSPRALLPARESVAITGVSVRGSFGCNRDEPHPSKDGALAALRVHRR
jgi:hypothetical protein